MCLVSRAASGRASGAILPGRVVSRSATIATAGRTASVAVCRSAGGAVHRRGAAAVVSGRRGTATSAATVSHRTRAAHGTAHRARAVGSTAGTVVVGASGWAAVVVSLGRRPVAASGIGVEAGLGVVAALVSVHGRASVAVAAAGRAALIGRGVAGVLSVAAHVPAAVASAVAAAHITRIALVAVEVSAVTATVAVTGIATIAGRRALVTHKACTQLRRAKICGERIKKNWSVHSKCRHTAYRGVLTHSRSLLVSVVSTGLLHADGTTVDLGSVHRR